MSSPPSSPSPPPPHIRNIPTNQIKMAQPSPRNLAQTEDSTALSACPLCRPTSAPNPIAQRTKKKQVAGPRRRRDSCWLPSESWERTGVKWQCVSRAGRDVAMQDSARKQGTLRPNIEKSHIKSEPTGTAARTSPDQHHQ